MNQMNIGITALGIAIASTSLSPAQTVHAWSAHVCSSGQIRGVQGTRTFTLDTLNIVPGSQRDIDVQRMLAAWNELPTIRNYFSWKRGAADNSPEGDDYIHFVDRASIDGVNAHTTWSLKPCWPAGDGHAYDIKMKIANDLAGGPNSEMEIDQTVRGVIPHELGHALGGNHETRMPNMLYNPAWGSLKVGSRSAWGTLVNHTDAFVGDDLSFANAFHSDQNMTDNVNDYGVSGQGFNGDTFDLHTGVTMPVVACRGNVLTYNFTVVNRGFGAPQIPLVTVLSSDSIISKTDTIVDNWTVFPASGTHATFLSSFVVPNLVNGDYQLGTVLDPNETVDEYEEGNNTVWLNATIRIGC